MYEPFAYGACIASTQTRHSPSVAGFVSPIVFHFHLPVPAQMVERHFAAPYRVGSMPVDDEDER